MSEVKLSHQLLQDAPRVVAIRIAGDADASNGRDIESYFDEAVKSAQPRHVLLDLGELTFADTSFFSSLLFWREESTKRGGMLVLFGLRPEIASTMRIMTLDRVLTVRPDQAAALAALPAG